MLLLSQCAPWAHIHVHILWNQKYNMNSHSKFLCQKIVLLSVKLGGKKIKQWRVTLLQKNKISTTYMPLFSDFFTYCFVYLWRIFGASVQPAGNRNIINFFGQMVSVFTPILKVLTSIHIYICHLFLQFKYSFREDWFHEERR